MATNIKARIVDVSKKYPSKLFAVERDSKRFHFVEKAEGDYGLFDLVQQRVREDGQQFDIELQREGSHTTMTPPEQFLDIYRDGAIYVVDTSNGHIVMDPFYPRRMIGAYDKMVENFGRALYSLNPFLGRSHVTVKSEEVEAYYRDHSNIWCGDRFEPKTPPVERAKVLEHLLNGRQEGLGNAHLILNTAGEVHNDVFVALSEQLGYTIRRHRVN